VLANAAFYYGVVRVLAEQDRPIWTQMSFSAAEESFHDCAKRGIEGKVFWPGLGEVPGHRARPASPAADGVRRSRPLGRGAVRP
jgi:hypothetical protein